MGPFILAMRELAAESGIGFPDVQLERMAAYYALLEQANRSFNLTSIEGPRETAVRHFVDSLAPPALALLKTGEHIIDVGSGAGFPGVPLAIVRGDLHVTLLDSSRKRMGFLESVALKLGLINVSIVTARAEDYAQGAGREAFDAALSRAVAPLNVLLEYTLPFVRKGGRALAWKGPSAAAEISSAAKACRILGGGEMTAHRYTLPGRSDFYIVEIRKLRPTPRIYPRKAGKPSAEPIK